MRPSGGGNELGEQLPQHSRTLASPQKLTGPDNSIQICILRTSPSGRQQPAAVPEVE